MPSYIVGLKQISVWEFEVDAADPEQAAQQAYQSYQALLEERPDEPPDYTYLTKREDWIYYNQTEDRYEDY